MDRLSIVLIFMTGPALVGGLLILVLSLGYYNWQPIAAAIAIGLILTWPAAYAVSRWIKRDDPGWRSRSGKTDSKPDDSVDFPET
ncbi:hypothetical protein [Ruegeria marina]|uniref:Uncharacterized protein n=1 Tax=Ruegeria marina TaxID=639004 RepID=A0A1G6I9V0_9RHOB|nr:hypothetical protein [Ruegeria marina]SDC03329.1 hypothetical protein SAMN04488239_10167 [Ruegeria marina]